jgi:hypothetical protein
MEPISHNPTTYIAVSGAEGTSIFQRDKSIFGTHRFSISLSNYRFAKSIYSQLANGQKLIFTARASAKGEATAGGAAMGSIAMEAANEPEG